MSVDIHITCPKCHSDNIDWLDPDGEILSKEATDKTLYDIKNDQSEHAVFKCNDCGTISEYDVVAVLPESKNKISRVAMFIILFILLALASTIYYIIIKIGGSF